MINLFEYQNKVEFENSFDGLEDFLDEIWKRREKNPYFNDIEDDKIESQRFLQFIHKSNELKSNKYVGVIHYNGIRINLLPKIFYEKGSDFDVHQIQNHILWWLSYCRKIKFPNYVSALGNTKSDFFEVLIYLFSKYTKELLASTIYQQYIDVHQEVSFIKGRLNVNDYIRSNLSTARWYKVNCSFDIFSVDNEFNRIIKYVSTLLLNVTTNAESKKNLREILFTLDEVTTTKATADQCSKIVFNPMFGMFETVRDYCKLFLSNCISFDYKNDLKLFAFLLPMEYVFEDFVFGFIEKEINKVKIKAQRSDTHLDIDKLYMLKPDLFIQVNDQSLIADTKYKMVYSTEKDPNKQIAQGDLYQMIVYAMRFKVDKVLLFYPNTIKDEDRLEVNFVVEDKLADNKTISINAYQLPIINKELFQKEFIPSNDLNQLFETTKQELKERIIQILNLNPPSTK